MDIKYANRRLYINASPLERVRVIPLIPSAKLDRTTGSLVAPVSSLLPIMLIGNGVIKPLDEETNHLMLEAKKLLSAIESLKADVKKDNKITVKDYPFLMKHQAICNKLSDIRNRYAFYLDTGTRQDYNSVVYYG